MVFGAMGLTVGRHAKAYHAPTLAFADVSTGSPFCDLRPVRVSVVPFQTGLLACILTRFSPLGVSMNPKSLSAVNRRDFLHDAAATAAAFAIRPHASIFTPSPKDDVVAKIAGQHAQTVKMLQDWIALPSIA